MARGDEYVDANSDNFPNQSSIIYSHFLPNPVDEVSVCLFGCYRYILKLKPRLYFLTDEKLPLFFCDHACLDTFLMKRLLHMIYLIAASCINYNNCCSPAKISTELVIVHLLELVNTCTVYLLTLFGLLVGD